jgi:hypothetical protein
MAVMALRRWAAGVRMHAAPVLDRIVGLTAGDIRVDRYGLRATEEVERVRLDVFQTGPGPGTPPCGSGQPPGSARSNKGRNRRGLR